MKAIAIMVISLFIGSVAVAADVTPRDLSVGDDVTYMSACMKAGADAIAENLKQTKDANTIGPSFEAEMKSGNCIVLPMPMQGKIRSIRMDAEVDGVRFFTVEVEKGVFTGYAEAVNVGTPA